MTKPPLYTPPGGPPQNVSPSHEIYKIMGEENIFKMLEDFYIELGKSEIKDMFPEDVRTASKKSGAFFVFLLGGPPLYQEKYGSPMLRKRHFAFKIDEKARLVWLKCFKKTVEQADIKYNFPMEHMPGFMNFLDQFSIWMVNTKTD